MVVPSRQATVLLLVSVSALIATVSVLRSKPAGARIAFWFDRISDDTLRTLPERFGRPIDASELKSIESIAVDEIAYAFKDFQIAFTTPAAAAYRIRVVDTLRIPTAPWAPGPSAESRSIPGLGGQGAVNFRMLAHNAIAFAPAGSDRAAIIEGIGRGIGRAAVHEFTHQLLGATAIHDTKDVRSYEYFSASRVEQYYGAMRWDIARPFLIKRIGLKATSADSVEAR